MAIKTREILIEVARQLFARKGIENTTMSDIANASERGRRTIYTYFKSKGDIYNAVIESESEHLVAGLRDIVDNDALTPTEKLARFIDLRLNIVQETVNAGHDNPMYRTLFIREVRRMERIRRLAIEKELELLQQIISQGLQSGEFSRERAPGAYTAMLMLFQGTELSYMRNNFMQMHVDESRLHDHIRSFILAAIADN